MPGAAHNYPPHSTTVELYPTRQPYTSSTSDLVAWPSHTLRT